MSGEPVTSGDEQEWAVPLTVQQLSDIGGYSLAGTRNRIRDTEGLTTYNNPDLPHNPLVVDITRANIGIFLKGTRSQHACIVFDRLIAEADGKPLPDLPEDFGAAVSKPETSAPKPMDTSSQGIKARSVYPIAEASALLSQVNPFYTTDNVLLLMLNSRLTASGTDVTGKSMLDHLAYMEGKRFFEGVEGSSFERILADVNSARTRPFTLDEAVEQARLEGGEYLVQGTKPEECIEILVKSDDGIILRLQKGVWMTARHIIEAGSGKNKAYLGQVLKKNDAIEHRQPEKSHWGYIHSGNLSIVGLNSLADIGLKPTIHAGLDAIAPPVIEIGDEGAVRIARQFDITPSFEYRCHNLADILPHVNPYLFSSAAVVEELWNTRFRDRATISHDLVLALLDEFRGVVFLDSRGMKYIAAEAGVNVDDIKEAFGPEGKLKQYVTSMSPRVRIVRQENLPNLCEKLQAMAFGEMKDEMFGKGDKPSGKDGDTGKAAPEKPPEPVMPKSEPGFYVIVSGESKEYSPLETNGRIIRMAVEPRGSPVKADVSVAGSGATLEYAIQRKEEGDFAIIIAGNTDEGRRQIASWWFKRSFDHYVGAYEDFAALVSDALATARRDQKRGAVEVIVNKLTKPIEPWKEYKQKDVAGLLKLVHPAVFSDFVINAVMSELGDGKRMPGHALVEYLEKVEGIISPTSTSARKNLAVRLNVDAEDIDGILKSEECCRFLHEGSVICIRGSYLLEREMGSLNAVIHKDGKEEGRAGDNGLAGQLEIWRERLNYVLPTREVHQQVISIGLLRAGTKEVIYSTHESFRKATKGCSYFDFEPLRESAGSDNTFEKWMRNLADHKIIREIQGSPVMPPYRVLAPGKTKKDVYRVLAIAP